MRQIKLLVALLATVLLAAGCGGGTDDAPGFSQEDLTLTVGGNAYRCDVDIQAVIADLGADYGYAEGMSCDYDGLDKTYTYDAAVFYTNPLSQGDLVNEIYTTSPTVTTSRGITVGATRDEILAAYGQDFEEGHDQIIYRVDGQRAVLCFELYDGVVEAISLTTQPI